MSLKVTYDACYTSQLCYCTQKQKMLLSAQDRIFIKNRYMITKVYIATKLTEEFPIKGLARFC